MSDASEALVKIQMVGRVRVRRGCRAIDRKAYRVAGKSSTAEVGPSSVPVMCPDNSPVLHRTPALFEEQNGLVIQHVPTESAGAKQGPLEYATFFFALLYYTVVGVRSNEKEQGDVVREAAKARGLVFRIL